MPSQRRRKSTRHRWTLPDGRGGQLTLRWELVGDRLSCVGLSVDPEDGTAIDAADLRRIRVGQHLEAGRKQVSATFLEDEDLAPGRRSKAKTSELPVLRGADVFRLSRQRGQPLS